MTAAIFELPARRATAKPAPADNGVPGVALRAAALAAQCHAIGARPVAVTTEIARDGTATARVVVAQPDPLLVWADQCSTTHEPPGVWTTRLQVADDLAIVWYGSMDGRAPLGA